VSTPATGSRSTAVLALLCTVQFMLVLDNAIANVALPRIQADLGFSVSALQYVVSLYALTFGGFLILAGRGGDLFGRRRFLLAGVALFSVASLMCGIAQSQAVLLAGRGLQGLGGALAAPAALSLITTTFAEGAARNRALGIFGAVAAAGATAGLIIGGALTDALSWRWVFYVNVPVGVAALVLAPRLIGESRDRASERSLDIPGAVTVTGGLAMVVYGVTRGQQDGFTATSTLVLLGAAAMLLGAFVLIETNVRRPLVPFRFFRRRAVSGANVVALASTGVIAGQAFFSTLYLQQILGFSPIETGLSFLPLSVTAFVGSGIASQLAGRIGTRLPLAAGLGLMGLGTLALTGVSPEGSYWGVLPGFVLFGLGLGLSFVSQTITATAGVDPGEQGLASGLLNTSQQLGFAIGVAGLVSVAVSATDGSTAGSAAAQLVDGYTTGYLACGAVALAGVIAALVLVPRVRPDSANPPASEQLPVATGTPA
jgi:EmrB/QacA subfamily drug resistance transporter